jgi:hypothetical protein
MKKLFLLSIIAVSFLTAKAQVDPAFTAKFANVVTTAKDYYLASETDKPFKLEQANDAILAFKPITSAQFSSKLNSMLNCPTEMAKLAGPVGFINCIAGAANTYVQCGSVGYTPSGSPMPPPPPGYCLDNYQEAIIQCAITHLTN